MKNTDKAVPDYYEDGKEFHRLRKDIGLIEFERTKEILLEELPEPPAVVYDIGGAYGEYSWWLSSLGYEAHLFDLSETNIRLSSELAEEYPGCSLASCEVRDARDIPRADGSADAVLLMGPLYHITDCEGRLRAVKESFRLLKSGGVLFAAALTPFSVLLDKLNVYSPAGGVLSGGPALHGDGGARAQRRLSYQPEQRGLRRLGQRAPAHGEGFESGA